MSGATRLHLPKSLRDQIAQWAERAYPNEGCGLLIGRFSDGAHKTAVRFASLSNELLTKTVNNAPTLPAERQGQGRGKTEFVMNPEEFNRETLQAEKDGLDVIGVVHTHPDHPPRPSAVDASQPFLAMWSNIIVAVEKGRAGEMKSWFRPSDDAPFAEEEIRLE